MRYYLYIDKDFIQSLFGSIAESNFDIDIIEFSLSKSQTITKDFNVSPGVDVFHENGCAKSEKETQITCDEHERQMNNFKAFIGEVNTYNTAIERKYINVEEVSGIKKQAFYYKLIEQIEKDIKCDKICKLNGKICPCRLKNPFDGEINRAYDEDNLFFYIQDKYVWLEKEKLHSNLLFLSTITKQINVIGFTINKGEENEIVKAIALYI